MSQKYALISGASSGIGYAVALKLCKLGYKVFGCAPEPFVAEMYPLRDEYGLVPFACDITKVDDVKKAVELVGKIAGGRLDILYNNAGIGVGGPAGEADEDDLDWVFRVNVFGHIYMTKYFLDSVIATRGTIVFTCSVASRVPIPWTGVYCATKAAIDQYAWNLHAEMKPFGVRVHSIVTGGVYTAIADPNANSLHDGRAVNSRYQGEGFAESMIASSRMSRDTKYSTHRYANSVVKDLLRKSAKFNLYHGYMAYTLHLLGRYAPVWFTEFCLAVYFKQLLVLRRIKRAQSG
ncbi:1-acyl dihydroxyacetone phosphate reductase ribitol 2-dehydrogenase [Suhomyces tanzawaensis NRRL Y-17324]|uniref:1-acyl dihydroxyacetone phosphate reductase ribitol 2-dehydrogenase n=1 Tax=Suhomyces tanzawaensis NRRL Y-17324 TaxID=984487 RepID=A0A1E4SJ25_9ASCO|nr:1-acyl dihydroxyacetone phosphate reductase ribitol 2-dehydrogenase [Suhomyces tanzawaensis NRRL Y-17324]ODV79513.1 1-acyl dihydroxyacetone phosphate reductase ribitol 2-dehydrogenase [Suhomyces tanzawaensis NRRL Y-17324]